jgi:hypothetical protein
MVDFSLARESRVKISLCNSFGEQVIVEENSYSKGSQQLRFNTRDLTPGVYLLKIEIITREQTRSEVVKVVLSR